MAYIINEVNSLFSANAISAISSQPISCFYEAYIINEVNSLFSLVIIACP